MIRRVVRVLPCVSALLGPAPAMSGCRSQSPSDAPPGWSLLVSAPDTVLLDTARIEWAASDARLWLRVQRPEPSRQMASTTARVTAVETNHDVSCERHAVRDLEIRAVGGLGQVVRDSVVAAPSWIPAAAHPALHPLLPALCARLSQLHPRGLDRLLGSDRP